MVLRLFGTSLESITDGPGIRYAVFAQGCPHLCTGCHNPDSHDFNGGYEIQTSQIWSEIKSNPLLDGVTFSGGEPFIQAEEFAELAAYIKTADLNIICYSGYTLEELIEQSKYRPGWQKLLDLIDILIDGRFEQTQKSYNLRFRGSKNQRAIDVQASARSGRPILYPL